MSGCLSVLASAYSSASGLGDSSESEELFFFSEPSDDFGIVFSPELSVLADIESPPDSSEMFVEASPPERSDVSAPFNLL